MILAAVVAISLAILGGKNVVAGLAERKLIVSGVVTTAKIADARPEADGTVAYTLNYTDQAGNAVEADGPIETKKPDELHTGQTIDIRYDPANPTHWTDRSEPRPWPEQLLTVLILLPLLALALAMMIWRRRQMLRVWRDGNEMIGRVIELRQSPIAPRSRALRLALNSPDRKIVSILYPLSSPPLQKDDEMILVVQRGRAIVAQLYKELNH
jgi:hypothetical protein